MAAPYSTGMSLSFADGGKFPTTGAGITTPLVDTLISGTAGAASAWMGQIWWPEVSGTKNIVRVGFRLGNSFVKSNGTGLTASLQDVSITGSYIQPDGVVDQSVAIANADAGFIASAWYRTNPFDSARTVSYGDWVALVLTLDSIHAGDAMRISYLRGEDSNFPHYEARNSFNGSAWGTGADSGGWDILFEFDDGTFGRFARFGFIFSNLAHYTYNSGSISADEVALEFAFTQDKYIEGAEWILEANVGDVDVVLYQGTTALATATLSAKHTIVQSVTPWSLAMKLFSSAVKLNANTLYRLSVKPKTTDTIGIWYFDVADTRHMDLHCGGRVWCWTDRVDAGAWSAPVRTRRPFIWPILAGW